MNMLDRFRAFLPRAAPLYLFNTRTGRKELFELPRRAHRVRMYNCGPTVYGKQHVGNLSMFVFTDILRRALEYNGFEVKQVINFTDVGHLSSDADEGEDKMALGLRREGLPLTLEAMKTLGRTYAAAFLGDLRALNINSERIIFPYASDYIPADIAMVRTLEEKGYAYRADAGVYFDTARFPGYGKLGNIDVAGLREGARVTADPQKRSPTDFLLWKSGDELGWDSPWGKGFPGWHVECSAMIRAILGERIDIHTGGIEHIPIHHNNEIAQSEAATGRSPLSRFWLHRAHVQIEGGKIAKSHGNAVYLSDILERSFHPFALRYLFLQAHYRSPSNFSWEALKAAQNAYANLLAIAARLPSTNEGALPSRPWLRAFKGRINDDLDTPGALAVLWDMTKDARLPPSRLRATLERMDEVLGLRLLAPDEAARRLLRQDVPLAELPEDLRLLVEEREAARRAKNWRLADELRHQLKERGYPIDDTPAGPAITKLQN